jgi:RNA polymerase sigma-70 factor (ECF subfamily)
VLAHEATAALVVRAQRGEAEAFAGLARAFLRAAYSVGLAVLGRPADAEDVAQDSLLVALERIGTCREPERFAGWLLQIVRNRARNALEARRLRDVPDAAPDRDPGLPGERSAAGWGGPGPSAVAEERAELAGLRRRLLEALENLSEVQREVVLLHDLEEWTHPEIAAALGMSEVMSRQHLFQARRVLRGALAEDAPAEVNYGR